jgi:hypothetical protein
MGMDRAIFHKDNLNARVMPEPAARSAPEPEYRGAVFEKGRIVTPDPHGGPPAGSVDLCSLVYDTPELWGQSVRLQDVVASIDNARTELIEVIASSLGERVRDIRKGLEEKIAALDKRVATAESENETLRASLAGLEKQHTKLASAHATLLELAKREPPPIARIVGWDVDPENATATPRMSDGSNAAALPLLALFVGLAARFAEAERPTKRGRAPRANEAERERAA